MDFESAMPVCLSADHIMVPVVQKEYLKLSRRIAVTLSIPAAVKGSQAASTLCRTDLLQWTQTSGAQQRDAPRHPDHAPIAVCP